MSDFTTNLQNKIYNYFNNLKTEEEFIGESLYDELYTLRSQGESYELKGNKLYKLSTLDEHYDRLSDREPSYFKVEYIPIS
jgi:hypothetical protein